MRNNYNTMVKPAGSRVMTNSGVLTLRFYGQHGAKPRRELVSKHGGLTLELQHTTISLL